MFYIMFTKMYMSESVWIKLNWIELLFRKSISQNFLRDAIIIIKKLFTVFHR